MAFLQFQVYEGPYVEALDPADFMARFYVPSSEWDDSLGRKVRGSEGVLWRFSAPGFLDCTEWEEASSEYAARLECEQREETCPDCSERLPDDDGDPATDPYVCPNCQSLLPSGENHAEAKELRR